jgi:hypothetical protein
VRLSTDDAGATVRRAVAVPGAAGRVATDRVYPPATWTPDGDPDDLMDDLMTETP